MAVRLHQAGARVKVVPKGVRLFAARISAKPPSAKGIRLYRAHIATKLLPPQNWYVANPTAGVFHPIRWFTKRNGAYVEITAPE